MKREPVVTAGAVASAVVAVAAIFNIVLDLSTVQVVVTDALILVSSLAARQKVTPVP